MTDPIHIGPYRLRRIIASSPVAMVWAATHRPTQRAVALKVLRPEAVKDRRELKSFRTELRRTSSLSNPNVVHIYETGFVDSMADRASRGKLRAGTPFLVMELCSGGTLDEIKRPFQWVELKRTLISLLDGLAHIHSRNVIHRSLRPATVLLNGINDERQGLKLAGFGLAYHIDGLVLQKRYAGIGDALHYMAPEQLLRSWRDVGPWTDLYSLGGLAHHLASNRRPFPKLSGQALVDAQLTKMLPPLKPTGPVPAGVDAWIARLTHKDLSRRFQRAADAAWALIRLGDVRTDLPATHRDALVVALDDGEPTLVTNRSGQFNIKELRAQLADPQRLTFSTEPELTEPELTVFQGTLSPDIPPVPTAWQEEVPYHWAQLRGTGLGLFAYRTLELVNRQHEREQLWTLFRAVVHTRSARLVRLAGRAGIGKTRLSQWLVERAHELGAATVLKATHSRGEAPGTSVRRMFSNFLRLSKLSRENAEERTREFLARRGVHQADETHDLVELIFPSARTKEGFRRGAGVAERHAIVRRFFRLLTLERPLIIWLEDAHWGNDTLGLAYSVLENQQYSPMPVLFLLTTRDETLAERPIERALLHEIDQLKGAHLIELAPLSREHQQTLAQHSLGLEESLAAQVVQRCGGSPQLAVEVVGDWVQRGALESTPAGFVLTPGQEIVLPDDIHHVWLERVERVLTGLPRDARSYLEAAAVLGMEVDESEWRLITDHPRGFHNPHYFRKGGLAFFPARARIRAKLADRLIDFRLAEETEIGWCFTHGMIRESLLRSAQESGHLIDLHRAAAAMLEEKFQRGERLIAERLGLHLVESRQLEAAIEPLMVGVDERRNTLGVLPALALLATCKEAFDDLQLPLDDPRWGRLWLSSAQLAFMRGDYDEAERWSRRAAVTGADHHWDAWGSVIQQALYEQAQIALRRGKSNDAAQLLRQLKASVSEHENPRLFALAMHGLAQVALARGQTEAALLSLGDARRGFEIADDPIGIADCWQDMANIDLLSGDYHSAGSLFRRAIDVYHRLGQRQQQAACINGLAEVARHKGNHGEAEAGYRQALTIFESVGSSQWIVTRLNLALLHLKQGAWTEAHQAGQRAHQALEAEGRRELLGTAKVVLLAAAAGRRDWEAFDLLHDEATKEMRATAFCSPDAAWAAHKTGDLAIMAHQAARARKAYRFAWYQYQGLKDEEGMARIEHLVGSPEN